MTFALLWGLLLSWLNQGLADECHFNLSPGLSHIKSMNMSTIAILHSTQQLLRKIPSNHVHFWVNSSVTDFGGDGHLISLLSEDLLMVTLMNHSGISVDILNANTQWEENDTVLLWGTLEDVGSMIKQARDKDIIGPLFNWIIISHQFSADDVVPHLEPGDRVVVIDSTPITQTYVPLHNLTCTELLKRNEVSLHRFGLIRFSVIGKWGSTGGWTLSASVFPPFRGFYGKVFTIAALPVSMVQFRQVINGTVYYGGYFFEILNTLASRLKFRYKIVEPSDMKYGNRLENGSWSGAIGMVQRKEADFAVGPFVVGAERMEVVDFLISLKREKLALVMKKPDYNGLNSAVLVFKPFRSDLWAYWALSIVFSGLVIWLFGRIDPKNATVGSVFGWVSGRDGDLLLRSLWYCLGMAITQGGDIPTQGSMAPANVLIGFLWLTYYVLAATYTANLIAFMSVTVVSKPINSLEELATSTYKMGVIGHSAHELVFQEAESGLFKDVWTRIKEDPGNLVANERSGFERALADPNFVFITENTLIDIFMTSQCDFVKADQTFFPRDLSYVMQKNSPYQRIFNEVLLGLTEVGLLAKWVDKYIPRSQCAKDETTSTAITLGLESLQGPFFLLIAGACLGALTLMAEISYARLQRQMKIHPVKVINVKCAHDVNKKPDR